ncbi:hypothetical protein TNCV_2359351 [Trichonephila clavipes]|nr:hypothetical protein TNCV_2359351 [Trichonephila clavipes]
MGSTSCHGQWDTTGLRAYGPHTPSNVSNSFKGICFPEAAKLICPAELWCACSFFADRTIYLSSAGVVLLTRPPRAVYYIQ